MEEENKNGNPAEEEKFSMGKFKSVEALAHAYAELEAEFTRRSQRLKALEEQLARKDEEAGAPHAQEELLRAAAQDEGVRARIVSEYLQGLRGVPLMAGGGAPVATPVQKPVSIRDAGKHALEYLRKQKR